jgi:chemotaxis protein histidine kinase CheA
MDTLAETLWQEFAVEAEEHLQVIEPVLARADPEHIGEAEIAQLFRSFHSVKGLARALGLVGMEEVAHRAENLLGLVREGRAALTAERADLLLQSIDALKRMRDRAIAERRDEPGDNALLARLAAAFAHAGGSEEEQPPPVGVAEARPELHDDPEMLAIFVEMVKSRGSELCGGLSAEAGEREVAADAAATLDHAAAVMGFDALAESFSGFEKLLQPSDTEPDERVREELLARLGDIRLQVELLGEMTGQDAGIGEFSAALMERIGADRRRLAAVLTDANRQLRAALATGDGPAAAEAAATVVRLARALRAGVAAQSADHATEVLLLVEDLYSRVAHGAPASTALADAADAVFTQIAEEGLDEAAELTGLLRASFAGAGGRAARAEGGDRLVAGLHLPDELLAVLSDDNLAEFERGVLAVGLQPYEILVHLDADSDIAGHFIDWLSGEARAITNRTVITDGESSFEFLVLSPLMPNALAELLRALDPEHRCIRRVRRLTSSAEGEPVLDRAASERADAAARPSGFGNLLRVRGELVDAFLDEIGELRISLSGLTEGARDADLRKKLARCRRFAERLPDEQRRELLPLLLRFAERDRWLRDTEERLSAGLSRLYQSALELRVVPVEVVFNRLPRLVRDLAQRQGKSIELVVEGHEVRVDRSMVEALADPLIHLVRNAVDHGIEPPEERRAAGKPERARLRLRAAKRGAEIDIEIADDGRGLDAEAIRVKAVVRGLVTAARAAQLADEEIFQFIFAPGLSTAAAITETSGRGVGMDVVLNTVRRCNGSITLRSVRGRGTAFVLTLPVSAALQSTLIVRINGQSLAIPERHVIAVAKIEREAIRQVGAQRATHYRDATLPLYSLAALLGITGEAPSAVSSAQPIVVAGNGRQTIGLEVDEIEHRRELFLKPLHPLLAHFPTIGGASVVGDGRVVLVLDGEQLLDLAARGIERAAPAEPQAAS